jgi:CRP-like cAMP-binding protein
MQSIMQNSIPVVNGLIERLPRKQQNDVLQNCETMELVFGDVLCETGHLIQHVYFPIAGFVSLLATLDNHPPMEMDLVGNEGMVGITLILDVDSAPMSAVVQGAGTALRMGAAQFPQVLSDNPALRRILNRYAYTTLLQLAQTATCTHFHEVDVRLARWLLMTHDRVHADDFYLTHQFLADMLGVQRSAVTIAAGVLQQHKLISYTRGKISIIDRKGLEAASCGCYEAAIRDYARILS